MRDTGRTGSLESESGMETVRLALRDVFRWNPRSASVTYRLTLLKGHVFRLPRTCPKVHVLAGTAWVTAGRKERKDIILEGGETALFAPEKDFVLIEALGNAPLNLEIQGIQRRYGDWWNLICGRRWLGRLVAQRKRA